MEPGTNLMLPLCLIINLQNPVRDCAVIRQSTIKPDVDAENVIESDMEIVPDTIEGPFKEKPAGDFQTAREHDHFTRGEEVEEELLSIRCELEGVEHAREEVWMMPRFGRKPTMIYFGHAKPSFHSLRHTDTPMNRCIGR